MYIEQKVWPYKDPVCAIRLFGQNDVFFTSFQFTKLTAITPLDPKSTAAISKHLIFQDPGVIAPQNVLTMPPWTSGPEVHYTYEQSDGKRQTL